MKQCELIEGLLADKSSVPCSMILREPITTNAGGTLKLSFYVLKSLLCELVLGMPWLSKNNSVMVWQTFVITYKDGTRTHRAPAI